MIYGGEYVGVSYNKLWKMMIDKHISKTELTHLAGISLGAMKMLEFACWKSSALPWIVSWMISWNLSRIPIQTRNRKRGGSHGI